MSNEEIKLEIKLKVVSNEEIKLAGKGITKLQVRTRKIKMFTNPCPEIPEPGCHNKVLFRKVCKLFGGPGSSNLLTLW